MPVGNGKVVWLGGGYEKAGKAILAELSRRQLTPEAVTAILLTHSHPDHVAAIDLFPKAEVMALEPELPLLEGRALWRGPLMRLFSRVSGGKGTHVLHDGERGDLGQGLVPLIWVPVCTPGNYTEH